MPPSDNPSDSWAPPPQPSEPYYQPPFAPQTQVHIRPTFPAFAYQQSDQTYLQRQLLSDIPPQHGTTTAQPDDQSQAKPKKKKNKPKKKNDITVTSTPAPPISSKPEPTTTQDTTTPIDSQQQPLLTTNAPHKQKTKNKNGTTHKQHQHQPKKTPTSNTYRTDAGGSLRLGKMRKGGGGGGGAEMSPFAKGLLLNPGDPAKEEGPITQPEEEGRN